MLVCFLAAALRPELWAVRLAAAVAHTAFSVGCAGALEWGHGQYAVLWTSWGLVLGSPRTAVAVARAAGVYLYVCAGLAKLCVPPAPEDYLRPGTMRALMSKDGANPRFNPLWPRLSRAVIASDRALLCATWLTMGLELLLVPGVYLLPGFAPRAAVAAVCMAFHTGIWLTFSSTAGTMFYQLAGVYAFGFCGADLGIGTPHWAASLALALAPLWRLAVVGDPFVGSERWPSTNFALFPWSESQIAFVERHLRAGSTRLVLTARQPPTPGALIGRPVTPKGQNKPPAPGALVLHDAVGNVWNWTKVYPQVVAALNDAAALRADGAGAGAGGGHAHAQPLSMVAPLQRWLQHEAPVIEAHTGDPLTHVYLVELDPATRLVRRVISG